jgi:SAM-dependent methyltransferase
LDERAYCEQFELEDEHWWFTGRRRVLWSLLRRTGPTSGLRLLDAGCGTGRNLIEFRSLGEAAGIDSSADAVEYCRRRGIDGVRVGALEELPFADGAFDLVLATDVIEHLRDDGAGLAELRRVAKSGARLLVTVPAYRWLWSEHDDAHHHFRRYTLRELRRSMAATGWEPVAWSYFNATLLAPIAAVRMAARLRRTSSAGEDRRSNLKLTPRAVNHLLELPLALEAALIARGARLPAGVSIGMVCTAAAAPSRVIPLRRARRARQSDRAAR